MTKPAVVHFTDDTPSLDVDHVDPHDGYVYAQKGDTAFYWPWHRVQGINRDLSDDAVSASSDGSEPDSAVTVVNGP